MLIQLWNQQGGSHSGELGRCVDLEYYELVRPLLDVILSPCY